MAPKLVLNKNRNKLNTIHNNFRVKKLNRSLMINTQLRKRISMLTNQNKELSTTRNNLLLYKLSLEKENNSIKNSNIQLTAMHSTMCKKLKILEQTLHNCVPALVTLSQCIPSMIENVYQISKFDKVNELNIKEKKERQTKAVKPMVNGLTITTKPTIRIQKLDLSSVIVSPNSEQALKRQRKSSNRSSPQRDLSLEPYVRLKDVAVMLKNSKTVSNENSPKRQSNENLGEGPSWLHAQENEVQNSGSEISVTENSSTILNEISTSNINDSLMHNEVQTHVSTSASTSIASGKTNNMLNETEINESSMLTNTTRRKRQNHDSGDTSNENITSDMSVLSSSTRPKRSKNKSLNYKETNIRIKPRRDE